MKNELYRLSTFSGVVAVLVAAASLSGVLFSTAVYPGEVLRQSSVPNDLVSLVLGLPFLLGAIVLARRGRLLGLLFWPGALLFITYNYLSYTFAASLTWQKLGYLALMLMSAYVVYRLLAVMDAPALQKRLAGRVPERFAGGVMAGLGLLFLVMRLPLIWQGLNGHAQGSPEVATSLADLLMMPLWIAGGILLWRKHPLGYASGTGLLFQGSMLFVGLLAYFVLQPVLSSLPFPAPDFIVILVMGLICFVPLGLFVRGVMAAEKQASNAQV